MDDKDDPYNKSYSAKPPLPPFSSLRQCSSTVDGNYGASGLDRGYGVSLSPYQQQQQLYSFNPYIQGHPQYHQPSRPADFQHPDSAGCLQRSNRSQLINSQSSSFHGNSTQGSHFQVKDQPQFLRNLQHPPIPDMSLSLPFSVAQSGMLASPHLPIGIQSFPDGRLFRSNTDHPPQIPLSQVESLLSEAEQKSISNFSSLPQTLDNRGMNSSWQSPYNSVPAQTSEQLPSFSSFSSLYSGASNTKDMYYTSELPSKPDSYSRYHTPESINSFTTSTPSLPGYTSQYQLSANSYSGNCFLPKQTSGINSSGIPFSNFNGVANGHGEQNNMFHLSAQINQITSRSEQQETYNVADQTPATTKVGRKGRKKKKMSEKSLDTEVKSLLKKKKPKTLKKAKFQPVQEPSGLSARMNSDNDDSASPTFCLSPTFIASLSSKRATDPQLSDAPHSGPYVSQQNNMPQISHAPTGSHIPSLQSYYVSESSANYFSAPTTCHGTVSSKNQFSNTVSSQMSYASARLPSVNSSCQGNYSRNEPQIFSHQTSPMYTPNINTECKPSKRMYNEAQRETEENDKSLSPFQLSPGFIASLSSKRNESHPVQKSLMEITSLTEPPLESHSRPLTSTNCGSKYQFSRQQAQTSVPLSADHVHNELPYSNFPSSFVKQAIPPSGIQLYNKPELYTPWISSFQKPSLEYNFKNMPRQACSPKQYVSPPAYTQGSEFQYPTPPMDDDESKLQSPGLCMSPKFLDSLSNKIASGELSHRLSPVHDDNTSVLPTPPNSAGPKQPYMPDITLSKEEQTSRILEIIAREREKMSATYQSSPHEPRKKKKKKKSDDLGNSGDCSKCTSGQSLKQIEQHIYPYCSESSADSSYQKYPEIPGTLPDHSSCFGKLNTNTAITDDNGTEASLNYHFQHLQQQQMMLQENKEGGRFDSKEEKAKFRFDNSESFRIGNMCSKNETLQRNLDNLQVMEGQKYTSMAPKVDVISFNKHLYRSPYLATYQDPSSANHFPLRKPDSTPKMFEENLVKADPYAFDDSEQTDMIVSMTRNMKPVPNMPCLAQTKLHHAVSISHLPCAAQTKPLDISVSNVPFTAGTKPSDRRLFQPSDQQFNAPDHMLAAEKVNNIRQLPTQQIWGKTSHPQRNHQIQPDKMFIENELLSSQSHNYELNPHIKHQLEHQHKPQLINSTTPVLKDQHYQNMQHVEEHNSVKNTSGLSFCSEGTIIKQESHNLSYSMQEMADHHKSFPDSFSTLNSHVPDILKQEANELLLDVVKKKRGRPPKHDSSTSSSPAKSKVPKLKLHEKKLKIQAPKKLVYGLNGTEVSPSDLNLNKNLVDRLVNNLVEVADCSCLGPDHIPSETTEGPYYTQLGAARDIPGVRKVLEQRTGISGTAIRIEKVIFTGKEGKSKEGCPIAKWIIRRSGPDEKYLCIVRKRPGHFCDTAVIIMVIVAWEGVDRQQADTLYDFLISTLPQNGLETDRRCGLNEKKTCACQGVDLLRRGASFSFGCSWSMYYNGCKFARSQMARKFKLKDVDCEDELDDKLQKLATDVAPLYSQLAPDAFRNQTQFETQAHDCRLGKLPGRPFSGVTAVVDFCCHSHRDCHNMNNGSTVVVNLTKHRGFEKPEDEQYHVLPLYILDQTDELGSMEGQMAKVRNGSLEVLSRYMTQVRRRSTPYRPCQRNRTTPKKQGLKKGPKKSKLIKAKSFPHGDYPDEAFSKSENSSFSEDGFLLPQSPSMDKINNVNGGRFAVNMVPGVGLDERNPESMSYTDLMSQQGTPGFGDLYTKFWDYFYTHGEFPPCEWMSKKRFSATSKAARSSLTPDTLIQPSVAGQMFLHHQQWQQQEQRRIQQHNVQNQAGQSQQHENQRQQNFPSCLAGKQDLHSPSHSPQSQYPQISPRQQYHSHSYQCETSVPKSPQALPPLPLHPLSVTPHQGSVSQNVQSCIPTHSSIPLTSSKLQRHPSESSPHSGQSHFITSTSTHQSEASRSRLLPFHSHQDHFNGENSLVTLHQSSQNSPTCSQSPAIILHAPSGGCDDHPVKPPPPYHQSVSNQHNMQCGPSEALCSFQPQGPSPPSYCESLAQSAHNIIKLNDSQGDFHALRFTSNNLGGIPQSGPYPQSFNQSVRYPSPANVIQTQLVERPQFQPVLQKSFISNLHERPSSTQSGSERLVSRPPSTKSSEGNISELQRPPSSQSSPRSVSVHLMERPQSTQPIPKNSCVQSTSCPTLMQHPSRLTQSLQKPCTVYTRGPHAAQMVKRPASAVSAPKSVSEQSAPRSLSLQFLERRESFHSVDGSHLVQREQMSPSSHSGEMSPSQSTTSGPWCINQQQCYQRVSNGPDSSIEQSSIEYNDSNSMNKFNTTGNRDSCMSDAPIISSQMQVKSGRERSWSRMSEPTTMAEAARPSSCSSEPGLVSGWRAELPFNGAASDILRGKHNFETWHRTGPNMHHSLDKSTIVNSENSHDASNSELKEREFGSRLDASTIKESSCFGQSAMLKTHDNSFQQSYMQGKEKIPLELNYSDFVNGRAGTVYPNGPVIGEKMKVHKSEGFVVPKLGQGPSEPPYEVIDSTVASEEIDDNLEAFNDPAMGGVAIALCHGAVIFEVAKRELHATTALKEPNRYQPKRISLVFYQHKNLNLTKHGFDEYERKIEERRSQVEQARLIEEMESKGFLKGELSELASFPNLTKGTFGKVFNFPESRETLFPLRFPLYLDCSHSEQITPVMFACMSIAFPKYMKEAFPDPAQLPRLISSHMPGRMHSSLSDRRRDFRQPDSEIGSKELHLSVDNSDKSGGTFQRILSPWNPNTPQGNTVTTDRVITRWVHDDVSVTGPYNRWVELILQDPIKKEEVEAESEADLKEKMFESLSELDHEAYISNRDMSSGSFKYSEKIMKTCHGNQDTSSATMVINLEPSSSDLNHSTFSDRSLKKEIELKPFSVDDLENNETAKNIPRMFRVVNDSSEFSETESSGAVNNSLESYPHQRMFGGMMQPDPTNSYIMNGKNEFTEKANIIPDSVTLLRNGEAAPKPYQNLQLQGSPGGYTQISVRATADNDQLKALVQVGESRAGMGHIRESAIKDKNINPVENTFTECQTDARNDASRYISVIGNPGDHFDREDYTSKVKDKFEENVCNRDTKRRENVYDFLMNGLNRSFLSSQPILTQDIQDEFPTAIMNASEAK